MQGLGEFTVSVEATGYKAAQKEISIAVAIQYQEDVYLERDASSGDGREAPGGAVLAPKAREAFNRGTQALKDGKLEEAQKYIGEAMKLAPANPDVLYLQAIVYMKQSNWERHSPRWKKPAGWTPISPTFLPGWEWTL